MLTEADAQALLNDLCSRLGFCLPPDEARRLNEKPPPDVRSFTHAVFRAEGLDPTTASRKLYRQVRDMVADAFTSTEYE